MLGLWIPDTLSSPLADVVTSSGVDLPSEPGAPARISRERPLRRTRGRDVRPVPLTYGAIDDPERADGWGREQERSSRRPRAAP